MLKGDSQLLIHIKDFKGESALRTVMIRSAKNMSPCWKFLLLVLSFILIHSEALSL